MYHGGMSDAASLSTTAYIFFDCFFSRRPAFSVLRFSILSPAGRLYSILQLSEFRRLCLADQRRRFPCLSAVGGDLRYLFVGTVLGSYDFGLVADLCLVDLDRLDFS